MLDLPDMLNSSEKVELYVGMNIPEFSSVSIDSLKKMLSSDLNGFVYKGPAVSGKTTLLQAAITNLPSSREMFPVAVIQEAFEFDKSLIEALSLRRSD